MTVAVNLKKLVGILAKQVQDWEDAIQDVAISRQLKYARGAQLDKIGDWVGLDRTSTDDDAYRKDLQLEIYINNSSGTPPEMAYIAQQLTMSMTGATAVTVRYVDIGPASYRLVVSGSAVPAGLLEKMQAVSSDGVRLLGIHSTYPLRRFHMGDHMGQGLLVE